MLIDRAVQKEILDFLAEAHPMPVRQLVNSMNLHRQGKPLLHETQVVANCEYLRQHGLIESGFEIYVSNSSMNWLEKRASTITHKGIDFLLDDGGLSAILGVVTVKLERSTLIALINKKIEDDPTISHGEKSRLMSALSNLSDRAFEKVADTLIEKALDSIPDAGQIGDMLGRLIL